MKRDNFDPGALGARLDDIARSASYANAVRFSRFLDPSMIPLAKSAAKAWDVHVCLWGGYDAAERCVAAFSTDQGVTNYPVVCLKADWDARYGSASHRDLLGAQMGLGLERDCLGDIVMGENCAYLFVHAESMRYVKDNLTLAGRCTLNLCEVSGVQAVPDPKGKTVRVTVSSMRLDALVSSAYKMGRSQAQALIERGLVKLNHIPTLKADAKVPDNALISARGYGRMKVVGAPGETKKGRLGVELFVYGD